jgi:hypothetical protein
MPNLRTEVEGKLYQDKDIGIYIGIVCFVAGSLFSALEARK